MPTLAAWLGDTEAIPAGPRAALAWRRILDKPTSVAFRTPTGTELAEQTVRIEVDNRATMDSSAAGDAPKMTAIVYGVRDYPLGEATGEGQQPIGLLLALTHTVEAEVGAVIVADTVMAEGYRFIYAGDQYRIDDIILQIGEIQGVATATG